MGFSKLAFTTLAALLVAGCGGTRYFGNQQNRAQTPPVTYDFSTESYVENEIKRTRFRNALDLREYMEKGFDATVPMTVRFYNEKFGEDMSPEDAVIDYQEFWLFSGDRPVFRYDLDGHSLVLEYTPHSNVDEYARRLGRNKKAMGLYDAETFGLVPHEVAHWFHDNLLRKYGCKDFSGHVMGENVAVDKIKCMIVEGTAVYMAKFLDKDESFIGKEEYKSPIDSIMSENTFFPVWAYPAGEEFVTPILDKDFKNGIRLLSENFPDVRTVQDVKAYQAEILRKLDGLEE
jgi:hypothetical protein